MQHLKTEQHTYMATDGGALQDPAQRDKMLANFMPPKQLMLRVDAQVMLIKNMDELLVNGSMGKVIRFADAAIYAAERGADDYTFEGSGKGGSGASGAAGAGGSGPAAKKKAPPAAGGAVWPVVQFSTPKGSVEVLMQPETWKVELPNGEVQVSRTQLPLILSWAMSIHKSQGQTLERVKVDLGKVFEKGACGSLLFCGHWLTLCLQARHMLHCRVRPPWRDCRYSTLITPRSET
jgi:ATP-dependent DNA helicase PIF1